jgi:hypothetical protein
MLMTPSLRKLVLTLHVSASVGSLGAVAAFLALSVVGITSEKAEIVRAMYPAMELIARFVIVPLVFASVITGVVQSLGTPWGLFRHYWVIAKLGLSVFAAAVLLVQMRAITEAARLATETTLFTTAPPHLQHSLVVHAAGGLVVLIVATILSVYKPRGLTPFGARAS